MTEDFVCLYSHCVIVKGHTRSSICDLQRNKLHMVPNTFADLFADKRHFNITLLAEGLDQEDKAALKEYLAFLEDNELVFMCSGSTLDHFPPLYEELLIPAQISNCILDAVHAFPYFNPGFVQQLADLCCHFIQFRFFGHPANSALDSITKLINSSHIKSAEIILPCPADKEAFYPALESLIGYCRKISRIVVTGETKTGIYKEGQQGMGYIIMTQAEINHHSHCGITDSRLFSINIPHYTESLAHNSCLNRKIAIDAGGNIRNCPSMQEQFGNIKDTTLMEAISKPGFTKYWNITKDKISKCKDCEFRHVCTDCRAYLEHPDNLYSAPLKCGYDPYTCTWEDWSSNPLKQGAIDHYGMRDIVNHRSS